MSREGSAPNPAILGSVAAEDAPRENAELNNLTAQPERDRGSTGVRIGAVALLALVAAILIAFGVGLARKSGEGGTFAGFGVNAIGQTRQWSARPLPDITVHLYSGRDLRLPELTGSVSVVNFWASWCVPCRAEAPVLARAATSPAFRDVRFVGVNEWDPATDAMRFLRQFNIGYDNGPDPGGRIGIDLGLTGIPETYVANAQGIIVAHWVGPLDDGELAALIQQGRDK